MKIARLAKQTFVVTGATGFIGSCLVRRLVSLGARPHILIRKDARLWRIQDILPSVQRHVVDIADEAGVRKAFQKIRPDVVYHLAANGAYSSQNDPDRILSINYLAGWNLLKAAKAVGCSLFVNTGSSSEYGFKKKPMKETDSLEPASYYAVTKSGFTWLCHQFAHETGFPVVTLRPFSVYGPYEEPSRLIPRLMATLFESGSMDLVPGKTARDFIYVDDMVDAYLKIDQLKKCPGEVFNIGTGQQSTLRDAVDLAVKVSGRKADLRWGKMSSRSWDANCWVADISKAKRLLGWTPKVSLKKGLGLMWDWYGREHEVYQKSGKLAA